MWSRAALVLAVGVSLFACADPPRPRPATQAKPTSVARHMLLIVTEDDGTGSPTAKKDSIVLAEPLERVPEKTAFAFTNAEYKVALGWDRPHGKNCLAITVERDGAFRATGCVPTDEPSTTVAMFDRPSGGSVEVVAWFFDADGALPSTRPGTTL